MIEIRTLGRTAVAVDGVELTGEAAWPKSLALIVYLAREPGPDRRDDILRLLWPDRDEKRARHALNQLLYTLRKTSPELDLESIKDRIDFATEVWLDVDVFEERLDEGDLAGAVDLYDGPFLDDVHVDVVEFEHWADRQRSQLRRRFRKAVLELAERAKADGSYAEAVAYSRRLMEDDPLDDEAQHLLIESLYLSGNRVAALRQYQRYRALLASELDVEPLDHTQELVERIRSEAPGEELEAAEIDVSAGEAGSTGLAEPAPESQRLAGARRPAGEASAPETVDRRQAPIERPAAEEQTVPLGGRRLVLVGLVAAVAALIALTVWLWPGRLVDRDTTVLAGGSGIGRTTVAVLPFEAHGLDPNETDIPGSLARQVSANLDGLGPLGVVEHARVQARWRASPGAGAASVSTDAAVDLARELNAASVVLGAVYGTGDRLRLGARLIDAESGDVLARTDARAPRDSLFGLADRITLELLEGYWSDQDSYGAASAARSTRSLAALRDYVIGSERFRRGQWTDAVAAFRSAAAHDSAFAPALRGWGEALLWSEPERLGRAGELFERAIDLAEAHDLPERERRLAESLLLLAGGTAPAAIDRTEELAADYPDDLEVAYRFADASFHLWLRSRISLESVAAELDGVLARDPGHVPTLDHRWWTAMWANDRDAAERAAQEYVRLAPENRRAVIADLATDLRYAGGDVRRRALERLSDLPARDLAQVVIAALLGREADPAPVRDALDAALTLPGVTPHPDAALLLAALELASGRPEAARARLEGAEAAGLPPNEARAWRALAAVYGLTPASIETYPAPEGSVDDPEGRSMRWIRDTWLHGAVALQQGDFEIARAADSALSADRQARRSRASTLEQQVTGLLSRGLIAELTLAMGDTASGYRFLYDAVWNYPAFGVISSPFATAPYYRALVARLEAAQGDREVATRMLRSLNERSPGDLLFRPQMHLLLGELYEELGEPARAHAEYEAAARWWRDAEPAFGEQARRAVEGAERTAG